LYIPDSQRIADGIRETVARPLLGI